MESENLHGGFSKKYICKCIIFLAGFTEQRGIKKYPTVFARWSLNTPKTLTLDSQGPMQQREPKSDSPNKNYFAIMAKYFCRGISRFTWWVQ